MLTHVTWRTGSCGSIARPSCRFAVTRFAVDSYRAALEPAKPSTVRRRLACLAGFYEYAREEGLVQKNPVARVARPRVPVRLRSLLALVPPT